MLLLGQLLTAEFHGRYSGVNTQHQQLPKMAESDIELFCTDAALEQIILIKQNDYTLTNEEFRIRIGGKGCTGFTYETGFDFPRPEDLSIEKHLVGTERVKILLDSFTAFYLRTAQLDYLLNPETNEDGFVVINHDEHRYVGKFFKDESLTP